MKNLKFFLPFAAIGLLASCSNDNLEAPAEGTTPGANEQLAPGTYMNISISIPTANGSRAEVSLEDGEDYEYAVKDAILYLFNDKNGAPSTLAATIPLDAYFDGKTYDDDNTPSNDITVKKKITNLEVGSKGIKKENTYWALVILNTDGISADLPGDNEDFSEWIKSECTGPMVTGTGENRYFTMTNALGWINEIPAKEGDITKNEPTWLSKVDDSNLFYESQTTGNDAVEIYVQRVLAKVSLKQDNTSSTKVEIGDPAKGEFKEGETIIHTDYLLLTDWYLDVTNSVSYPVQILDGPGETKWYNNQTRGIQIGDWSKDLTATNYLDRFIGGSAFKRVYWAVDPNYDKTYANENADAYPFTYNAAVPGTTNTTHKAVDYCRENTFAVPSMQQTQSTRVVFKGIYYVDTNEKPSKTGDSYPAGSDFVSYNGKYYKLPGAEQENALELAEGIDKSCKKKVNELFKVKEGKGYEALLKALDLGLTSSQEVEYHKGGEVYYYVIIRHFNDDQLGFDNGYTLIGNSYDEDTRYKDNQLLGRYGVVRNNWYELSLNGFAGPGTSTVPELTPDPDDNPAKLLLNCEINILSWAKRGQDVTLGK